jgi:hypothetical protein
MDPPTSSSLAEEKRLCSLLLSTAGARSADARSMTFVAATLHALHNMCIAMGANVNIRS